MSHIKSVPRRKQIWLFASSLLMLLVGLGAVNTAPLISGSFKVITPQRILTFDYPLLCLAVSPNGKMLAAGGWASSIGLWNLESGQLIGKAEAGKSDIHALAFSPTGSTLAIGADQVQLREGKTGRLNALDGSLEAFAVAFSPDSKFFGAGGRNGTQVWDEQKAKLLWNAKGFDIQSMAFSSDSQWLATSAADGSVIMQVARTGQVLWQVTGCNSMQARVGVGIGMFPLAIASNGNIVAQGTEKGSIELYTMKQGKWLRSLRPLIFESSSQVSAIAFSPDGKTLASGSYDQVVRLWAMPTGTLICKLQGLRSPVTGVVFSPDGQTLAGTSTEGKVALWNLR